MSIGGLHMGTRALQAHQLALEITGQNISNVNTEGYTRQRASLVQTQPINSAIGQIGTGVRVDGIERIRDAFVDLAIRKQASEVGSEAAQVDTYDRMESIFTSSNTSNLDSMIGEFFDSIYDVVNAPEETGLRHTTIVEAQALAQQIQFVNAELDQLRIDLNSAVKDGVTEINSLLQSIGTLNKDIVKIEAGSTGTANDMRDQRDLKLKELAEMTNITTHEMQTGEINVSINGNNVVFGSTVSTLATQLKPGDELPVHEVVVESSGSKIDFTGGLMHGYIESRDTNIVKYTDRLDDLSRGLIDTINRQHTQGMGLRGFDTYTSTNAVDDSSAALDSAAAGLAITPVDSTFNITVLDKSSGDCVETTVSISVDVSTDSLDDVAAAITTALNGQGISEVTATVTSDNELTISSSDTDFTYFIQDTTDTASNFLSAIGINTFFRGTDASDIGVNEFLAEHPEFFAAASSTADGDNTNALALSELRNAKVMDSDTKTLAGFFQSTLVDLGADSRNAQVQSESAASFLTQLELKRESVSGVSLDEEAANLIIIQRAYEASARYISVVDSLLNTLVNGIL
jgi:flagellar hook-associated protein 1